MRGKKLLIVWDDKQVSPTAPFVEEKKLLQLRHNFLMDQPHQSLLLPGSSLFDLANAIFPGSRVMLQEHFRCVEPIIRFSFQFALIQRLLLERIGEQQFLAHRIECGDSATFQGKERDIIFLSMVASSGQKMAQTSRLFQQRFNVALSRARDRMYLFRSVEEHELNPNDLKAKVIAHFRVPMIAVTREQEH